MRALSRYEFRTLSGTILSVDAEHRSKLYSPFYWLEAKYVTGVEYFAPEALLSPLKINLWLSVTIDLLAKNKGRGKNKKNIKRKSKGRYIQSALLFLSFVSPEIYGFFENLAVD